MSRLETILLVSRGLCGSSPRLLYKARNSYQASERDALVMEERASRLKSLKKKKTGKSINITCHIMWELYFEHSSKKY